MGVTEPPGEGPMEAVEQELIPYSATDLRGERLLVLAPHPDDEVIGCGGLVALHAEEGRPVRVVIATDGSAGGGSTAQEETAALRAAESAAALRALGVEAPHLLALPDRGLASCLDALAEAIRNEIVDFRPDLILLPGPAEIHPDHRALARAFVELVQRDASIAAQLAVCRVAFYEVSRPLLPNTLVDITTVAARKSAAIAAHASQNAQRDFTGFAAGLNRYRAMTLGPGTEAAEAYWVIAATELRNRPFSALANESIGASGIEISRETLPISVIVRTKDRPAWLREAVASVRAGGYPAQIVVVNDGGESPRALLEDDAAVRIVEHDKPRGRSEAMNRGVAAAETPFLAFLDDDDIYYPEHLATLATAAASGGAGAWYSDAVTAFMKRSEEGSYRVTKRLRLYETDFDRSLLLFDNYIPLPTLLVRRDDYLAAEGFDPAFDLFEDWDFLIRLSRMRELQRVPRVTCEIRHFEGSTSVILGADAARFREARLQVWEKHRSLIGHREIADVFTSQKERLLSSSRQALEETGRASHLEKDVARLERDKRELIDRIAADTGTIGEMTRAHAALAAEKERVEQSFAAERERMMQSIDVLNGSISSLQSTVAERDATLDAYIREVGRLNAILHSIYESRTWKLHTLLLRARGKSE